MKIQTGFKFHSSESFPRKGDRRCVISRLMIFRYLHTLIWLETRPWPQTEVTTAGQTDVQQLFVQRCKKQPAHVEMKERSKQEHHQVGGFNPTSGEGTKGDVRGTLGRCWDAAGTLLALARTGLRPRSEPMQASPRETSAPLRLLSSVLSPSVHQQECPLTPAWSCSRFVLPLTFVQGGVGSDAIRIKPS